MIAWEELTIISWGIEIVNFCPDVTIAYMYAGSADLSMPSLVAHRGSPCNSQFASNLRTSSAGALVVVLGEAVGLDTSVIG